ncbi:hypothetical protein IQ07DRAFT_525646 [Pyrenochaeta sp. DS3sAY3a]|nr:hypothetical protein IQ07DRAFT_525646 [Pyrenochaeta sp. DS3sAY3a]
MPDEASPLEGWDYDEYIRYTPAASCDVIGSLFYFLRDMLLRFCERIMDTSIRFSLLNVDARELPTYLGAKSNFDRIDISNICDRGYIGPEATLATFGPLLQPRTTNPRAKLLMLFLNAVGEVYYHNNVDSERIRESRTLIEKFIPLTLSSLMPMTAGSMHAMNTPEMIRISSCYTMFGDLDKAFRKFMEDVHMQSLIEKYGMKIIEQHAVVEPWPLRVTGSTSKEQFDIRCGSSHTGFERYVELERS